MGWRLHAVVLAMALACALSALGCERAAYIRILDARISRLAKPDNRVVVDIELEGVEVGGGNVGSYCVSFHVFTSPFDPLTLEQITYPGELDGVEQCAQDLSDGDQRTFRLISNSTTLASDLPVRVQVRQGQVHDGADGKPVINPIFFVLQGAFTP